MSVALADTSGQIDDSRPTLKGQILLALAQNSNVTSFAIGIDLPQTRIRSSFDVIDNGGAIMSARLVCHVQFLRCD
jgi:hypothetical protein